MTGSEGVYNDESAYNDEGKGYRERHNVNYERAHQYCKGSLSQVCRIAHA
jgi:hypothetical protein